MKIAYFLSSKNIIPPPATGGVEYASYYLVKGLLELGHEVAVFAAPGSRIPGAEFVPMSQQSPDMKLDYANYEERICGFYDRVFLADWFFSGEWRKYDLIHYNNHLFYEILPFAPQADIPIVARVNYPHGDIYPYLKEGVLKYKNVRYLPVSNFIKNSMPDLPYLESLHPGLDFGDFPFLAQRGEYLLFVGRLCADKGVHLAVEAARRTNEKLVIAGRVERADFSYFNKHIKPHIDNERISYVGEVDFKTKVKIYQKAKATLFLPQWDEPFGLVALESMACGAPVVALKRAAAAEIIKDGVSGFLVKDGNPRALDAAIKNIDKLKRPEARSWAEDNFSHSKQAEKYEKILEEII